MSQPAPKPREVSPRATVVVPVIIITVNTRIYDGEIDFTDTANPSGTEHPLVNGLAIRAGKVRAWNVASDQDCPLTAVFIAEDESGVYPGTPEGLPTVVTGNRIWKFKWEALPALGCGAVLRFAEVRTDGSSGATTNFTVHVFDDPANDPCPLPEAEPAAKTRGPGEE